MGMEMNMSNNTLAMIWQFCVCTYHTL